MADVLLWTCFLAVLAGTAAAGAVIARDVWRMLAARRPLETGADDAPVLTDDTSRHLPPTPAREQRGAAAGLSAPRAGERDGALVGARKRGLGAGDADLPRSVVPGTAHDRGLGSGGVVRPRAPHVGHRGLGARPHEA